MKQKFSKLLHAATHNRYRLIIYSVAATLIGFGLIRIGLMLSRTTGVADPPVSAEVVTEDVASPSEKKVDVDSYTVPADQPKMLYIPQIAVSSPIQKVGLSSDNAIVVPTNVHFAGWYTKSAKPGSVGLSVIDGHVSGRYRSGIFRDLTKLRAGDVFQVEYGDGSQRKFEVVDGRQLDVDDAAGYLLTKRSDIDRQLNLITCDGVYDKQTKQYNKRYVIVARVIEQQN